MDKRELATVLAALRLWQSAGTSQRAMYYDHFEDHLPLTDDEIDGLCEKLNAGEGESCPS